MNRPRTTSANNRTTPPRGRRGAVVGLLLMTLVFVSIFLALGVNVIRLRQLQTQLRNVCRASALAGAAELMDEGALYGRPDSRDDQMSARIAACDFGQLNPVDGKRVQLDPNADNKPTGDIVLGHVDPLGPVGQPIEVATLTSTNNVNTVRITARMSRNVSNRVTLWMGSLVGLTSTDVAVSAQASLDHRVIGFRAEPGVKAPLVPLIAELNAWLEQAEALADAETNDLYTVDPISGAVTAGPDGIPELTFNSGSALAATDAATAKPAIEDTATNNSAAEATAPSDAKESGAEDEASQSAGRFAALQLWNEENLSYIWPVRCREGLSLGDLREYGGALIAQPDGTPVGVETTLPEEVPYGLMDVVGQVRAWPLGEPDGESAWKLTGFAAARIVAVRRIDDGESQDWQIILQPATLASGQAVAGVDGLLNPWVAKLELTQ